VRSGLISRPNQAIQQNICIDIFTKIIVVFGEIVNISYLLRVFYYLTYKMSSSKLSPILDMLYFW
jgi:hypothetical protein